MNIEVLLPQLLNGLKITLSIFILTALISIPFGILISIFREKATKVSRCIIDTYILLMRGTPLLLQIIFVFFGLPLIGIKFNRFDAAVVAFILNYAAYFAEIFRAGIESIDEGQIEASSMLGLSEFNIYKRIILPQAFKRVIPAIGNEIITLIKDTSLVYIVGLQDILMVGKIATNRYASLLPLLLVGIVYILLVLILTNIFKVLEKKYNYYK
ncbi:amino acid ABC transporter permease [Clostridium sp.]|uniref:amino acid ABC transporter permease n=1 Tax=Clostridium sp. TaxID=1506 RepID=UPI0026DC0514|nr:amino acid ABC transporter permease [Clostridium sp.]MDO5039210.1 amino acid ABC transporter permease [Clostridium sp.]